MNFFHLDKLKSVGFSEQFKGDVVEFIFSDGISVNVSFVSGCRVQEKALDHSFRGEAIYLAQEKDIHSIYAIFGCAMDEQVFQDLLNFNPSITKIEGKRSKLRYVSLVEKEKYLVKSWNEAENVHTAFNSVKELNSFFLSQMSNNFNRQTKIFLKSLGRGRFIELLGTVSNKKNFELKDFFFLAVVAQIAMSTPDFLEFLPEDSSKSSIVLAKLFLSRRFVMDMNYSSYEDLRNRILKTIPLSSVERILFEPDFDKKPFSKNQWDYFLKNFDELKELPYHWLVKTLPKSID